MSVVIDGNGKRAAVTASSLAGGRIEGGPDVELAIVGTGATGARRIAHKGIYRYVVTTTGDGCTAGQRDGKIDAGTATHRTAVTTAVYIKQGLGHGAARQHHTAPGRAGTAGTHRHRATGIGIEATKLKCLGIGNG